MTTNKTRWLVVGLVIVLVAGLGSGYLWLRTSLSKTTGTGTLAGLAIISKDLGRPVRAVHCDIEDRKAWARDCG